MLTNNDIKPLLLNKTVHLIRHWRVGSVINTNKIEQDINILNMYVYFLDTVDNSAFMPTGQQLLNIDTHLVTLLKYNGH